MIALLNGLAINDITSNTGLFLSARAKGLGIPSIRTSSGSKSGSDGGYIGSQYFDARLITLVGFIWSPLGVDDFNAKRQALLDVVEGLTIALGIITDDGRSFVVDTKVNSFEDDDTQDNPVKRAFTMTLIAEDPTIYDNSAGGVNTAVLTRSSGGGLSWPPTWPLTWAAGAAPITVTNSGNLAVYPVITLNGIMTSPVITNATTGQFTSLPSFATSQSDQLVIDMRKGSHSVLLNGGSVYQFVTTTSTWWPLLTGNNSISLTTGSSSDTVTGTVSWRSGYRTI